MTTTITTAQREYYKRPADERFETLGAMLDSARHDKAHSVERTYNLRDLRAIPEPTSTAPIQLVSPKGQAGLTHYAFGQLARTIGAPAAYLRTLPAGLVADAVNHGLQEATASGTDAKLLIKANGVAPVIRSCTSETYGRLWDADLYGDIDRYFGDAARNNQGSAWMTPPAWPGSPPSGQYRGDRDSFVIRVDGGSIVTDPSRGNAGDSGQMYRGIMVRNSEVGHCSVSLECVLYRYICGNHCLWGAVIDRQYRRRHVGHSVGRDTVREILQLARSFSQRSASQDETIIRGLIDHEIAHTKEAVIDELKKIGYSKADAMEAYAACELHEQVSPRTYWGIVQGTTRISQASGYQDDRLALDQLAATVLRHGAQLVTV